MNAKAILVPEALYPKVRPEFPMDAAADAWLRDHDFHLRLIEVTGGYTLQPHIDGEPIGYSALLAKYAAEPK